MPGSFPADIIAAAQASRKKWNIPASVCLAQWALESAWGKAMPAGSNNPFGIKAVGTEPFVSCPTHEVINGARVEITAKFRKFQSIAEAFDAHGELLATGKPYAKARAVRTNPDAFANALTGVYATDPHYGTSLIGLMKAYGLYQYDATVAAAPESPVKTIVSGPDIVPAAKPAPAITPPVAGPHLLPPPAPSFWARLWASFTGKKD